MAALTPAAICGPVRDIGSGPQSLLVIQDVHGESFTLQGTLADELAGYPGRVCVQGAITGPVPQWGMIITVQSYRLAGDGKHAPIVGTLRARGDAYFIETRDRRRLRVVANDTTTLASVIDHLVWLTATWSGGALHLLRIGPLGR